MNADKVICPVLMGFNTQEAFYGIEMRTALLRAGVPVEFWVYPGEGHIFTGPEHRYISMERNLDWFKFWLKGDEDPVPTKKSQYLRWRQLRKQQIARVANLQVQPSEVRANPGLTSQVKDRN